MQYLIVLESGKKKRFPLEEKIALVGRGENCSIRLNDPSISEEHCRLEHTPDGLRLTDLGSKTGTRLNNKKVANALISEKDVIRIGHVKMGIRGGDKQAKKPDRSSAATRASGAPASGIPASGAPASGIPASGAPAFGIPASGAPASGTRGGENAAAVGSDGGNDGDTLNIRPEFKAASREGKNRLVRRRLRQGSRIPGWAQAVIVCWIVVAVVGVVIFVLKQAKPSPYQQQFLAAKNLENNSKPDAAIAAFEQIPLSDPQYGEQAQKEANRLREEKRLREIQMRHLHSVSYFENNIKLFIEKYIDAPEGDKAKAKKIREEYAVRRKSFVRVLMLDRLNYYIEHFKGNRDYDEVCRLVEHYAEEFDPLAPVYFDDAEIESEMWMHLNNYGEAQKALLDWKANQRQKIAEGDLKRLEKCLAGIDKLLITEWGLREEYVAEMEAKHKYKEANNIYHRFMQRCEGYDSPTAKKFMKQWRKKFDENERRIRGR